MSPPPISGKIGKLSAVHGAAASSAAPRPSGGPLYPVFLILLILSKQRRLLFALCAVVPFVALWALPLLPKSYTSEAVIQIRKSLSTAYAEDVGLKPTEAAGQISEDYRVVQTALLESQLLHDAVGRDLLARGYFEGSPSLKGQVRELVLALFSSGAEQQYVDHVVLESRRAEDAGHFVSSGISVRRGHKSPKISLSFQDSDSERAHQVLATLLLEYQKSLAELYDIAPILKEASLHLGAAERAWSTSRARLAKFEDANTLRVPRRQLEAATQTLGRIIADLTRARVEHSAASSRVAALTGARELVPKEFETSPSRYENRYRWMILDLLTIARKRVVESPFLEGTPEYEALQNPVEKLSVELESHDSLTSEQNAPMPNSSHYKVVADLALAQADEEAAASTQEILVGRVRELNAEIDRLSALLPEHEDLTREIGERASFRDAKKLHVDQLSRVKALGDADLLWSYKVLQKPTLPSSTSSPGRSTLFLGLILLGITLSVVATLLSGLLDRSVREGRELEKLLGVQPLASFPDLGRRSEVSLLLGRLGRGFLGRLEAKKLANRRSDLFDFSKLGPHSVVLESRLDALISAVERSRPRERDGQSGPTVFAVGGAHSGVGATTIAINLARRLSERNEGKTLLALRKSGAQGLLPPNARGDGTPSLSYDRAGRADVLFYSESNLTGSRDWAREFGSDYDRIVVDAPPALSSRESLDLLSGADVALLVARGDMTTRSAIEEAVHAVNNAGDAQVGLILNAHRTRLPDVLTCA